MHESRRKKEEAIARMRVMEADEMEGRLINKEKFIRTYTPIFLKCTQLIRSSKLTDAEQDTLLNELSKLHDPNGKLSGGLYRRG